MSLLLVILITASIISFLQSVAVKALLQRYRIIDRPNARSSHTMPTVRGGGIAIISTVMAVALWLLLSRSESRPLLLVCLCALALAAISFFDDLRPLSAAIRFAGHLVATAVALIALDISAATVGFSPCGGLPLPSAAAWALGCLWVVGYTNGFNFMDGINGIAAGQAAVTALGMALLASLTAGTFNLTPVILCIAISGAAIGFLPHNFPTARMFMGDVGSAPLGFLLALTALWLTQVTGFWLFIPLVLLHANFVLDTVITLFRRAVRGDTLYLPHRDHFYQRLVRSGKSHAFVTGWELGLQVVVLGLLLLYPHANVVTRIALTVLIILLWVTFFAYCELCFRRHRCLDPAVAQTDLGCS